MRAVILLLCAMGCDFDVSDDSTAEDLPDRHAYCCVDAVNIGDHLRLVIHGSEPDTDAVIETRVLRPANSPESLSTVTTGAFPKVATIADSMLLMWQTRSLEERQFARFDGKQLTSTPITLSGPFVLATVGQRWLAIDKTTITGQLTGTWITRDGALDGSVTIDGADTYLDATLGSSSDTPVFGIAFVRGRITSTTRELRVARWSADGQQLPDAVIASWSGGEYFLQRALIGAAADGSLLVLYQLDSDQPTRAARIARDGTIEDQPFARALPALLVANTNFLGVDSDYASGAVSGYLLDARGAVIGAAQPIGDADTGSKRAQPRAVAWNDGFAVIYQTRDEVKLTRLDASATPVETRGIAADYDLDSGCSTTPDASPLLLLAVLWLRRRRTAAALPTRT